MRIIITEFIGFCLVEKLKSGRIAGEKSMTKNMRYKTKNDLFELKLQLIISLKPWNGMEVI